MVETLNLFRNLYRYWKSRGREGPPEVSEIFRFRYACFRDLLDSNSQLLDIISDMETKLEGREMFGMTYVRSQATRAAFHAFRMVKSLDVLSGHKHGDLYRVVDRIHIRIKDMVGEKKETMAPELVLPYEQVTRESADWVGGKSANLGEVLNRVRLPIPAGFAVTTKAFSSFMAHDNLGADVDKLKMEIDPKDPKSIESASAAIRKRVIAAKTPPELDAALLEAHARLAVRGSGTVRVSVRSSAIGEDSDLSFAGQYLSVLNVPGEGIIDAYREVVASLFSSRAITYRLSMGIRIEDLAMGVACLEMIESAASGVIYSRYPAGNAGDVVLVTAVRGLGQSAVDGTVTPDAYQVSRDEERRILNVRTSNQERELVCRPEGGVQEVSLARQGTTVALLSQEQIQELAGYAMRLEGHFMFPQDIEWAIDRGGRLFILQTRPLRVGLTEGEGIPPPPPVAGYPLLLQGALVASRGVGCGPVFHVQRDSDLLRFPEGSVLVARHSSPKFVLVMPHVQAIITDAGSVAGHMASVAREMGVPCLLDARSATSILADGDEVTVDAISGRVYLGRVPEVLSLKKPRDAPFLGTPLHQTLRRVAEFVVPLNLLDPGRPDFRAESCRTLHDLGRLVHEFSYGEMFKVSDLVSDKGEGALRLEAPVPLDLFIIDLGDGLSPSHATGNRVMMEDIVSTPLNALLKGLLREDLRGPGPRPVELSGFFSVVREQMVSPPLSTDRFGQRSYAIISGKYLNFSSRIGYHYCALDAYSGKTVNKNYITFAFQGGAADVTRRHRRVRAIAMVLTALDFAVQVKADRLDARLRKYDAATIADRLEAVGRLIHFTRQMDMLMANDESVDAAAEMFLKGL